MLRLGGDDVSGAWQDVMAGYRLARLYAQGPLFVDRLEAFTLEIIAARAAVAVAMHEGVSAAQIRTFQGDLRGLPAAPPLRTVLDVGERLFQLNALLDAALLGPKPTREPEELYEVDTELFEMIVLRQKDHDAAWKQLVEQPDVDWNEVFRQCNAWHDRMSAAFDRPTWPERLWAIWNLEKEASQQGQEAIDTLLPSEGAQVAGMTPAIKARCLARLALGPGLAGEINQGLALCEQRIRASCDLTHVAFALAGYRREHGEYPRTIADLCPKHIAAVPRDPFNDADLHYRQEGNGYLLYSVGPNGKDDGGRNFNEEHDDWADWESATEEEKSWDDIAIRTPARL